MRREKNHLGLVTLLLAGGLVWLNPVVAGVSVSIQPDTTYSQPDQEFTVDLWIDTLGSEFDGYETVLRFDPEMLEFISIQEGNLMTNPCGNTWWIHEEGADSSYISHVILCGGLTVTGPGVLSSITFRALMNGITSITFDYIEFYRAGEYVPDISSQGGLVFIGPISGLREGAPEDGRPAFEDPQFTIFPSPSGRRLGMALTLAQGGPVEIVLYDSSGQRVARVWQAPFLGAGHHEIFIDTGAQSKLIAPGVYYLKLVAGQTEKTRKVILIP
ncbi:MAG: T9SS type A sorting domain-containing protein [Candidatus Eisenbacteria bacterium]|uniref:T9SS type A sorting domain-containing protein n=1 Tax=Eiseniibacteriota bacterium TaxID=2212470 RepID=A0A948RZI6_UNCEI|nr:T9SS type A sorting domain-containing protein [Candidatus Eisenbacteria bacterium]MBU1950684.1 T9SS type A sorting domain-containing protein [Candidatus Eisenbacteria bacterium]MBU2693261.1 T9SS type A sorting domain-containing protein [Candidatus Eisenbacteria bacterium]